MKKIFCILSILAIFSPALAECPYREQYPNPEDTSTCIDCDPEYFVENCNVCLLNPINNCEEGYTYNREHCQCEAVAPQPKTPLTTSDFPDTLQLPNYEQLVPNLKRGLASASYVKGAYDTIDYLKENRLQDVAVAESSKPSYTRKNGDVIHETHDYSTGQNSADRAPYVAKVEADNGVVTVTNTEVTVPIASYTQPTGRAPIWVE